MPNYEYECQQCRQHFDLRESITDHAKHKTHRCPKCGSDHVKQLLASVHVKTSRKS